MDCSYLGNRNQDWNEDKFIGYERDGLIEGGLRKNFKNRCLEKNTCASSRLPRNAKRPSAIKQSLSNMHTSSLDGWCIVHKIVLPLLAKPCMHSTIDCAMYESSPDVGSYITNKRTFQKGFGLLLKATVTYHRKITSPDLSISTNIWKTFRCFWLIVWTVRKNTSVPNWSLLVLTSS